MRRLSPPLRPGPSGSGPDDRGAVIVFMTVFLVVIVAMAALVLDVGSLLDERRQLQNGADAASLAVAHSCALGSCDAARAAALANDNSQDGESGAVVAYPVAGRVRVDTSTRGNGNNILPYSFGQVLSGAKGQTVRATATAAWGPVGTLPALPLTISSCDVQQVAIGTYSVISFKKGTGPCSAAGAPGAFGWLDGSCPTTTYVAGAFVSGDPGASGPKNCLDTLIGTDVFVPVYDTVTGGGTNSSFHIVGFAAFHLTGWRFPGDASSPAPCGSPTTCIAGTFIRLVTSGGSGTGADYGVNRVFLFS